MMCVCLRVDLGVQVCVGVRDVCGGSLEAEVDVVGERQDIQVK
jgi:hypothetical protein